MDGASFTHKMNPFDQARAPRIMVWRKSGRGLYFNFIGKGSHQGTGRSVHFMAAIAYGNGVVPAEQYFGRINADTLSSFVHELFASIFRKCPNLRRKLFLQDEDPSQNSCKVRSAWDKIRAPKRFYSST